MVSRRGQQHGHQQSPLLSILPPFGLVAPVILVPLPVPPSFIPRTPFLSSPFHAPRFLSFHPRFYPCLSFQSGAGNPDIGVFTCACTEGVFRLTLLQGWSLK